MVLEELYSVDWLKSKPYFAFLLGLSYSIIGMGGAIFLFPDDPALVAVALTSMLMIPLVRKLVYVSKQETEGEIPETPFQKYKNAFSIYILLFLGSFVAFAAFAMMLPSMAANFLFQNQLSIYFGSITGKAFSSGVFFDLFNNNLKVLMFSFIVSIVLGGGAIFIIIWNASLWGTIFGVLAKTSAATTGSGILSTFGLIFIIVFPHMILEVASYIFAAISGSALSLNILREQFMSERFKEICMRVAYLLIIGVLVLLLAMFIETFVLNIESYKEIIRAAFV